MRAVLIFVGLLLGMVVPLEGGAALARSAGGLRVQGMYDSAVACSGSACHSLDARLTLACSGPVTLTAGQQGTYTVTLSGGPAAGWGLDLAFTDSSAAGGTRVGTIASADAGVTVLGGNELAHSTRRAGSSVTFVWTAPAAPGAYYLWYSGISASDVDGPRNDLSKNFRSLAVTVTAPPDTTGPSVSITAPVDGAVLTGATAVITGTAQDDVVVHHIDVSTDGGVTWGPATIVSGGGTGAVSWSYTWDLPLEDADRAHAIMARAVDGVGNVGPSSADPTVRVDTSPPTVTLFVINADDLDTSSASVTLTLAATDGSPPVEVELSNDGTFTGGWQAYAPGVSWELSPGDGLKSVYGRFRDAHGNQTTATISDTITLDTTPPTIVARDPDDGQVDVSPTVTPRITFSDDMDPATIQSPAANVELRKDSDLSGALDAGDALIAATVGYDAPDRTAVVTPNAALSVGARYFVRVLTGVRNTAGLALLEPSVSTFVISGTADATAPTVVSVAPADGATDVSVAGMVTIVFSEPVDPGTVDGTSFRLTRTEGAVPVQGDITMYATDLTTAIFVPDEQLDVSTGYTVTVTTSVADLAGNTLAAEFTSTFTTAMVGISPHGGYSTGSSMCGNCHEIHGAVEPGEFGGSLLTQADETGVCYTCHDGSGASTDVQATFAGIVSGHAVDDSSTPPGLGLTSRCSSCHNPHYDAVAKPHQYRDTVNEAAVAGDDHTWCEACHNDTSDWVGADYPYPAGGTDDAKPVRAPGGYPVFGTFPGRDAYTDTTFNAHNPISSTNVVWPGSSRASGDCRNCHAAHGNAAPFDALVDTFRPTPHAVVVESDRQNGTYASLCITCHDGDGPSATDILQYVSYDYGLTGDDYTGGHRIFTPGGTLPVGAPLPCYDCHNPHGSKGNNGSQPNRSLISDERWSNIDTSTLAGVVGFCTACHLPWEYVAGSGQPEQNTVPSGQSVTVEGLDRRVADNKLSLPGNTPAHGRANMTSPTVSCYDCHGNSYALPSTIAGYNVHRPHRGGSCIQCHANPQDAGDGYPARRPVVGEFTATSHHVVGGAVDDKDCGVCHMEGHAADGSVDTSLHMNNQVELRDPDTGTAIVPFASFTRDTTTELLEPWVLEVQDNFCFKCHDSDVSRGAGWGGAASPTARVPGGTALRPFTSNGRDVPDIYGAFDPANGFAHAVRLPGANPYATASEQNGGLTTMVPPWNQGGTHNQISCFDCHVGAGSGHGAANPFVLRTDVGTPGSWNFTGQRDLCVRCHASAVYEVDGSPGNPTGSRFLSHGRGAHVMPSNPDGCRGCHAGLVDNGGLGASNGSPGSIHGGTFAWPVGSETLGAASLHYLYGGWLSGWSPGTCYGGTCHHFNGKGY